MCKWKKESFLLTVNDHHRRRVRPIRLSLSGCHVRRAFRVFRRPSPPKCQHISTRITVYPLEKVHFDANIIIRFKKKKNRREWMHLQSDMPRFSNRISPISPNKTAINEKNTSLAHQWPPVPWSECTWNCISSGPILVACTPLGVAVAPTAGLSRITSSSEKFDWIKNY